MRYSVPFSQWGRDRLRAKPAIYDKRRKVWSYIEDDDGDYVRVKGNCRDAYIGGAKLATNSKGHVIALIKADAILATTS